MRATQLRRGDAKWPAADRVGPGLYRLDYDRWGVRITLGWRRDGRGARNPAVDESWLLVGVTRREAAEAWRESRRGELLARRRSTDVIDRDGRVVRRVLHAATGDGPRRRLTEEGRARRRRALPPPAELFG